MRRSRFEVVPVAAAVAASAAVATLGLQEFGFSDYEAETLPAVQRLTGGDVSGFFSSLPGYGGAVILQAPWAVLGASFGGDEDLWVWRAQAIPGLLLIAVLGALLGSLLTQRVGGFRGIVAGAVAAGAIAGSPFGIRAETVGHPEDLLIVGLLAFGTLAAVSGRFATGGALVGLAAVAKPWAVVAVPVVLVATESRAEFVKALASTCLAGLTLAAPMVVAEMLGAGPHRPGTSSGAIFKPAQVFWFFGDVNPIDDATREAGGRGFDAVMAPYAHRITPSWASAWSHPLIVLLAPVAAGAYRLVRGREQRRHVDLLLLLGALLWWRCLLDTWNADYYALGALTCLAAWEVVRGRVPLTAVGVTAASWVTFRGAGAYWNTSPDVHTAIYLSWSVPVGVFLMWRAVSPASALQARHCVVRRLRRGSATAGRQPATSSSRA